MYFTFQESRIWEGANDQPDPNGKVKKVKAKSEERALKKLGPTSSIGRYWVRIDKTP